MSGKVTLAAPFGMGKGGKAIMTEGKRGNRSNDQRKNKCKKHSGCENFLKIKK